MRPERIGYVLKMYPRFSETFVLTELLQMQDLGVDLEVFSLRAPTDGRFHEALARLRAPVTYLRSHTPKAQELWTVLAAARPELIGWKTWSDQLLTVDAGDAVQAVDLAVRAVDRGITHLHAHFASVSARVARLAAGLAGIGYSVTAHAKDIFHADIDPIDLRRTIEDAAAVITISRYNQAFLRTRFPAAAERIHLVHNGIDLAEFRPGVDVRLRPARVAAVGRLVEKKGFGDLLDAVALLRDRGVAVEVDLVGTGELAGALAAQRDRLGLAGSVVLYGALNQRRVREIVSSAAVFAAPCVVGTDGNRDGLPTVLLEAMALGTPCVSTPVTGIADLIADGVNGVLVAEHAPAQLADALAALLADRDGGARLASAARIQVEAEFDTRRQARRVRAVFSALGAAGPADPGATVATPVRSLAEVSA